ncbi:hypothetical protein Rhal01_00673 [Rubritalea halochordaticola]|uniref:PEP-CTERM sorting domain-containing protein n=1 Tax=Rubritalea halochordaticola TaxID=714537 RepID=A0ABP9V0A0_9BACT
MLKNTAHTIAVLAVSAAVAQAATVSSVGNGNYIDGPTWSDGLAPSGGNDYVIQNNVEYAGDNTQNLAGDSVTINSGFLRLQANSQTGTDIYNINNLTLNGGALHMRSSNQYTRFMRLGNNVNVAADSEIRLGDGGEGFEMHGYLNGGLSGSGNLSFISNVGNSAEDFGGLHATVADSGFTGDWYVNSIDTGYANLMAEAANSLGTGAIVLDTRAFLTVAAAGGIDSIAGITLNTSSSQLVLTNAWDNSGAYLEINDGTLDLGDGNSVIGGLTIGGNTIANGTYDASQLTDLGFGGIYTGTGSLSVVPEPSTSMLSLVGACAFILRRKRH